MALTGKRPLSHGPGRSLRNWLLMCQPASCGPACTLPCSAVVGACGHSAAKFSARTSALACSTGCGAHGARSARRSACMVLVVSALLLAAVAVVVAVSVSAVSSTGGRNCASTCKRAASVASVPLMLAWADSSSGCSLPGVTVRTCPSKVACSAIGACACSVAARR